MPRSRTTGKKYGNGDDGRTTCRITNTATAKATDPTGHQITSAPAKATITVNVVKPRPCKPKHNGHGKDQGCTHRS